MPAGGCTALRCTALQCCRPLSVYRPVQVSRLLWRAGATCLAGQASAPSTFIPNPHPVLPAPPPSPHLAGLRSFTSRPVFSSDTPGDKHKMERWLGAGQSAVGSVYAPIAYPPLPVLAFKVSAYVCASMCVCVCARVCACVCVCAWVCARARARAMPIPTQPSRAGPVLGPPPHRRGRAQAVA